MHIRKRGNRYVAVVEMPRDPISGKRNQQWISGATEAEAREKGLELQLRVLRREHFDPATVTLAEYLQRHWLDAREWKPNTYRSYKTALNHIRREIGHFTLADMSPAIVEAFHRRLAEHGLSPKTISHIHGTLRAGLQQAVRVALIPTNPARVVSPPKVPRQPMQYWTRDQLDRFLDHHSGHPDYGFWVLATSTGARLSELLALSWDAVDLTRRTIRIERNLVRMLDGTLSPEDVKQRSSHRTIPLRRHAVTALHDHRRRQLEHRIARANNWHDLDLVFPRSDGHYAAQAVRRAAFYRAIRDCPDVPMIRFHDLRHTAASHMLALGMSIFEVSRILGHASTSITTDTYGHLAIDDLQASIDRLDRLENGSM